MRWRRSKRCISRCFRPTSDDWRPCWTRIWRGRHPPRATVPRRRSITTRTPPRYRSRHRHSPRPWVSFRLSFLQLQLSLRSRTRVSSCLVWARPIPQSHSHSSRVITPTCGRRSASNTSKCLHNTSVLGSYGCLELLRLGISLVTVNSEKTVRIRLGIIQYTVMHAFWARSASDVDPTVL